MSNEEAENLTEQFEERENHNRRKDFIARMERKLHHKERFGRSSY